MRWHRRVNRAGATALAFLALSAAAPGAWAETDAAVVSLPAEGVQFLPFYIAEDAGLYAQNGLSVKRVNLPGVATTNGVISGSVDFGFSNGASITRAAARGQKLVAIALMTDRPNWAILLRADEAQAAHFDAKAPLAARARIMDGKRFAVDSIQSVAHALERVIAKAGGVDPDTIAVSPLVATEAMAAMQRKAIDGMVIASPWRELLVDDRQAVVIADTLAGDPPWLTPFAAGLIITRASYCVDHRVVCEKMGRVLVTALAYIHDRPDDAYAILKRHFATIDDGVLKQAFADVKESTAKTPVPTVASVANADRLNLEAGFITADQQLKSYDDLVTAAFVK
jgi:ABC-type nitrate/sulfonate/bicarbonate transport system substrate-binding protein